MDDDIDNFLYASRDVTDEQTQEEQKDDSKEDDDLYFLYGEGNDEAQEPAPIQPTLKRISETNEDRGIAQEMSLQISPEDKVADKAVEAENDESDDSDIEIVMDNFTKTEEETTGTQLSIKAPQATNQAAQSEMTTTEGANRTTAGIDMTTVGELDGQSIFDVELDSLEDKPWRKPGADITDYFNYGFNEHTWRIYCGKQKAMRDEHSSQKRINVYESNSGPNEGMMPHDMYDRRNPPHARMNMMNRPPFHMRTDRGGGRPREQDESVIQVISTTGEDETPKETIPSQENFIPTYESQYDGPPGVPPFQSGYGAPPSNIVPHYYHDMQQKGGFRPSGRGRGMPFPRGGMGRGRGRGRGGDQGFEEEYGNRGWEEGGGEVVVGGNDGNRWGMPQPGPRTPSMGHEDSSRQPPYYSNSARNPGRAHDSSAHPGVEAVDERSDDKEADRRYDKRDRGDYRKERRGRNSRDDSRGRGEGDDRREKDASRKRPRYTKEEEDSYRSSSKRRY